MVSSETPENGSEKSDQSSEETQFPKTIAAPNRKVRIVRRASSRTSLRFRSQNLSYGSRLNLVNHTNLGPNKSLLFGTKIPEEIDGLSRSNSNYKKNDFKINRKVEFSNSIDIIGEEYLNPRRALMKVFPKLALKSGTQKDICPDKPLANENTSPTPISFRKPRKSASINMGSDKISPIKKRPHGLKSYAVGFGNIFAKQVSDAGKEAREDIINDQSLHQNSHLPKNIIPIKAPRRNRYQTYVKAWLKSSGYDESKSTGKPSLSDNIDSSVKYRNSCTPSRRTLEIFSSDLPVKSRNKKHLQEVKFTTDNSEKGNFLPNENSNFGEATVIPKTIRKTKKK